MGDIIRVVHKRVISHREEETGSNGKEEEGEGKSVPICALRVVNFEVLINESFGGEEEYGRD
jgi:hypothetical protein